jgi:hypothetical protein
MNTLINNLVATLKKTRQYDSHQEEYIRKKLNNILTSPGLTRHQVQEMYQFYNTLFSFRDFYPIMPDIDLLSASELKKYFIDVIGGTDKRIIRFSNTKLHCITVTIYGEDKTRRMIYTNNIRFDIFELIPYANNFIELSNLIDYKILTI